MFHLTLTGPMAGTPLCAGTLFDKPADGQNVHAMFASDTILASPDLCPACRLIWLHEGNDVKVLDQALRDLDDTDIND